jgi:hypothetical protein
MDGHTMIFFSETAWPIGTKLGRNGNKFVVAFSVSEIRLEKTKSPVLGDQRLP